MNAIIITEKDFEKLIQRIDLIDKKIDKLEKPNLLSDKLFDNKETCEILKISKRTLQSYRDKGNISFIQHGSKIYYRESDINKYLSDNYNLAFGNDF